MAVLNDYKCRMHGIFESFERKCPHGCSRSMVSVYFSKAPAFGSQSTANIDRELNNISRDYGLTDIRSDPKSGTSCMTELGRDGKQANWIDLQHAKPGFSNRGEAPPVFSIRSMGADKDATPGFKPGDFLPPVPIIEGRHKP